MSFGLVRAVAFVVMLAMLGELVAFAFVLRGRLRARWDSANSSASRLDIKYAAGGGILVILGLAVGQAIGFAAAPASILMDAIPAVLWGVGLSGLISSPSLGQGLGARPLWISLSLGLAFGLGAVGGLPAIT